MKENKDIIKIVALSTLTFICIAICLLLTGCGNVIKEKRNDVKVKVIDENHEDEGTHITRVGGNIVRIYDDPVYEITVEYDDQEFTIDDEDIYEKYHKLVGENVNALLIETYYDDNTIVRDIELN